MTQSHTNGNASSYSNEAYYEQYHILSDHYHQL